MTKKIEFSFLFLLLILPITLITGPAIPDITITLSGIFFLFYIYKKRIYSTLLKDRFFIISFFFWIYLLFVSILAENYYLSFRDSFIFIRLLLIPIFIIYWASTKNKFTEKILMVIFISIIFVVFDTLFQFINYDSEFGFGKDLFGFTSNWYGRLTGPFGNELIPGAYIARFSFLGLIYLFLKFKKHKFHNFFSILYLLSLGLTIFATGERMALATYSMGLIFLLIFLNTKRVILATSIILILVSILLVQKIHPSYTDYKIIESTPYHLGLKVQKEFICKDNIEKKCTKIIKLQPSFSQIINNFSKTPYGEIYKLSLNMFLDNKLFGIGLNNFTFLCNNNKAYNKLIKNYNCVSHPHNIHIQWLVETGLFGFIFFQIYLILIIFKIILKNINENSIISLVPILVMFWPIMSTGSLLKNWNGVSTFFIIGLCLATSRIKKKN
jgi:O-antigen ligase